MLSKQSILISIDIDDARPTRDSLIPVTSRIGSSKVMELDPICPCTRSKTVDCGDIHSSMTVGIIGVSRISHHKCFNARACCQRV